MSNHFVEDDNGILNVGRCDINTKKWKNNTHRSQIKNWKEYGKET
jgi:hypothetical protein